MRMRTRDTNSAMAPSAAKAAIRAIGIASPVLGVVAFEDDAFVDADAFEDVAVAEDDGFVEDDDDEDDGSVEADDDEDGGFVEDDDDEGS